jgi:hypothetical protein
MEQDYFEKPEKVTYETRMRVINGTFVHKMATLMQPHAQMRGNNEAVKMYLDEAASILCERLPIANSQEHLVSMLRNVWRECTNTHDSRYFFSFALINKAAQKVTREHNRLYAPQEKKTGLNQDDYAPLGDKSKPETQGWTIEKAQAHIAETRRMIADKELPYALGMKLLAIPQKALERLTGNAPDFDAI